MSVQVFISYKFQDEQRNSCVEKLYRDLRSNGIDAKLDIFEVSPGQSFSEYMTKGIRDSGHVLFIITPEAVKAVESGAGALAFEMQIANAKRIKETGNFSIIPIFREGDATTTYLSDYRYLDFRDDVVYESQLNSLVRWLKGQIKPPPLKLENEQIAKLRNIDNAKDTLENLKRFKEISVIGYSNEDLNNQLSWVKKGGKGEILFADGSIQYTRAFESVLWDSPYDAYVLGTLAAFGHSRGQGRYGMNLSQNMHISPPHMNQPRQYQIYAWDLEYSQQVGVIAVSRFKFPEGCISNAGYYEGPYNPGIIEWVLRSVGKFYITGYADGVSENGEKGCIKLANDIKIQFTAKHELGVWEGIYFAWELVWDDELGIICTLAFEHSEK